MGEEGADVTARESSVETALAPTRLGQRDGIDQEHQSSGSRKNRRKWLCLPPSGAVATSVEDKERLRFPGGWLTRTPPIELLSDQER
jgi:hypothetical protein